MPYSTYLSPIEDVIDDALHGRMFILVDDETRENEGDLVIPAEMADADAVNFMAKHGRGLICLSMTKERIDQLGLPLMSRHNGSRHETAFTISIESREGVTTGISAADRARTIAVAIDPQKNAADICSPGHVFPLVARNGGVLVRAGHTEAAVDIARLAGLNPSGVICEIMNDDGTMARMPDLVKFAAMHGLKIATIADLISYRRKHDSLIKRELETVITSRYGGDYRMIVYINTVDYAEHVALVKGDITEDAPVLVRMHALNILSDIVGDTHDSKDGELHHAMQMVAEAGRGVIVLIRDLKKTTISDAIRKRLGEHSEEISDLRDYGIGAQILIDLGVKEMTLLTNSKRAIVGLEGYGLSVAGYQAI
jgi:3,4-dihydroxy 2-butanone 4-phosphate synthase/GTP cyclohydrolase II